MSAERVSPTTEIFVALLDEGTDVWRPTLGRKLDRMIFEVLSTNDYDPRDEKWEFVPGAIVVCEERVLSGGPALVAVRQITPSPQGRYLLDGAAAAGANANPHNTGR